MSKRGKGKNPRQPADERPPATPSGRQARSGEPAPGEPAATPSGKEARLDAPVPVPGTPMSRPTAAPTTEGATLADDGEVARGTSAWAVAWRQFKKDRVALFAAVSIVAMGAVALLSPLLANSKPVMVSYRGRWLFPAFKDYLDENIPIPFDIPNRLRRAWPGAFSSAYPEVERPAWQQFPDWTALRREIDAQQGQARGDWYILPPVPFYYKENSRLIKGLPGTSLGRLEAQSGARAGKAIEFGPKEYWRQTWLALRRLEPELPAEPPAEGVAWDGERWVLGQIEHVAGKEGEPEHQVITAARPLKAGEVLTFGPLKTAWSHDRPRMLGTDDVGRDVLSRLIHGTVIAVSVGFVSVGIYIVIGIFFGALAGYFRGWVDIAVSRLIEIVICFPTFFLIITIVAVLKPSIYNIMIALGVVGWTTVARLVRGEFLKIMSEDYVSAAQALGFSNGRIMFKHVLPNAIAPVFVTASFGVASAILVESSLSFLGFGVAPPTASWGEVLKQGRTYISENLYHLVWAPGVCIFYTVTMFNLLGEGLRDALDPKLRT